MRLTSYFSEENNIIVVWFHLVRSGKSVQSDFCVVEQIQSKIRWLNLI